MIMLGSTIELTISQMLHPFPIEQRLEVHILQVEKYQVKETILRNTLMRHILIKVNVFCTMSLNPAPSGVGSYASGYVSGK